MAYTRFRPYPKRGFNQSQPTATTMAPKPRFNVPQGLMNSADATVVADWLKQYSGTFQFLKDMQAESTTSGLTAAQWNGVIKCYNNYVKKASKKDPSLLPIPIPIIPTPVSGSAPAVISTNSGPSSIAVISNPIPTSTINAIPIMKYDPSSDVIKVKSLSDTIEFNISALMFFKLLNTADKVSLPDKFILQNMKTGNEVTFIKLHSEYLSMLPNKGKKLKLVIS